MRISSQVNRKRSDSDDNHIHQEDEDEDGFSMDTYDHGDPDQFKCIALQHKTLDYLGVLSEQPK